MGDAEIRSSNDVTEESVNFFGSAISPTEAPEVTNKPAKGPSKPKVAKGKSPARKPKAKRTPSLRSASKSTVLGKLRVGDMVQIGEQCFRVGTAHPYGIDMVRIIAEPGGFRDVKCLTMGQRTKGTQVFVD